MPAGTVRVTPLLIEKLVHSTSELGGLLTQLVRANPEQSTICLSFVAGKPLLRLYERFGFKVVEQKADAVVICLGEWAYAETPGNIPDLTLPDGLFDPSDIDRYRRTLQRIAVPYKVDAKRRATRNTDLGLMTITAALPTVSETA